MAELERMPSGAEKGDFMLLRDQILNSLTELSGVALDIPRTVGWTAESGCAVEADFTVVDTLGCAIRELRVTARPLPGATLRTNLGLPRPANRYATTAGAPR